MAPKEPNRHQLSARLSYQKSTPAFLLKLQNRVKGITTEEDEPQYQYQDEDDRGHYNDGHYNDGQYNDGHYNDGEGDGYYDDGSGRPPIPQRPRDERPPIPERPDEDPGSADEDDGDEKPQVVVLKAGKHLTEWEAENVRRKERGLAPLPDPNSKSAEKEDAPTEEKTQKKAKESNTGLSFSSGSGSTSGIKSGRKRKVIETDPDFADLKASVSGSKLDGDANKAGKKAKKDKPKKEKKTLLSFGDDA